MAGMSWLAGYLRLAFPHRRVGEWSLDKRHYFGGYPPQKLADPPRCAQECAWVWASKFNEATAALAVEGQWPETRMGGTRDFSHAAGAGKPRTPLSEALEGAAPFILDGQHKPLLFFKGGRAEGPWGVGNWWAEGGLVITLQMCGDLTLTFDSETKPATFSYSGGGGGGGGGRMRGGKSRKGSGALDPVYAPLRGFKSDADAQHPAVAELLGYGPWAWSGITPMSFLHGGALHSPWGVGTYWPEEGSTTTVIVEFVGAKHRVTPHGCMKFSSVRESDGQAVDGWVQMGQNARSCQI
jgi:hypothetical protein